MIPETPKSLKTPTASKAGAPELLSRLFLTLGLLLYMSSFAHAGPPPGAGQWTLSFSDEFTSGTTVNSTVWNTGQRWDCINQGEIQAYRPENVSVANGLCTIKIEKKVGSRNQSMTGYECGTADYASAEIQTYKKWTQAYGYFEARLKMPTGRGTWPAFWLLPDRGPNAYGEYYRTQVGNYDAHDSVACPMGNEIDIFEYMGTWQNPTTGLAKSHSGYFMNYSGTAVYSSYTAVNELQSPENQFHTYGLYWGPGIVTYYIDGKVVWSRTDPASVAVCPHYVILNCAVSQNDWVGTVPLADIDASLPCNMDIDYVRVYTGTAPGSNSGDIGAVALSGSDSVDSAGVYTLTASGADISGTADAFHFTDHPVTGDCTITARVDSLTQTDPWAKAGVMLRQQIDDTGSPNALMLIPALAQARFQYRTVSGSSTSVVDMGDGWALDEGFTDGARTNGTDPADSAWYTLGAPTISIVDDTAGIGSGNALQIAATGSTGRGIVAGFPAQTLADGNSITLSFNWRFTGTVGLNQANSLRYGLHSSNATPATADNTTQADNDKGYFVMTNPGAAGTSTTLKRETGSSPGVLGGNDWSGLGTAGASVSGSTAKHTSTIVITRSGSNLVVSTNIDNLAAATGTDSAPVTYTFDQFGITLAGATLPSPILIDNIRVGDGMASNISPPNWVKLNRTGNVFTGYYSADGNTWTQVGSQTIAMPATIYAGLAATSHNNASLTTAKFSNVKADPFLSGQDIGTVGLSGTETVVSGTYSIQAAGLGVGGNADSCRYLSQTLIGDGTMTARVNSIVRTDYAAKAYLMIRDDKTYLSNATGSLCAAMSIPNLSNAALISRALISGTTTAIKGATIHPPSWVKLTRVGNLFTGYYSGDGITWTTVGSQTVPMGQSVKIGIAVSANSTTALTTAVLDQVTITGVRGL